MFHSLKLTMTFTRQELLATLRANLAKHKQIVTEAIATYLIKAREAIECKLHEIEKADGRIIGLAINLSPPLDYSAVYGTAIGMLEMSKDGTVTLQAEEFRKLVQDEWDWTDSFLSSNSRYSMSAMNEVLSKAGASCAE